MADKFPEDPVSSDLSSSQCSQFSHQAVDDRYDEGDVVVASRIQLHRNIAEHPFVGVSSEDQLDEVRGSILRCIEGSSQLEDIPSRRLGSAP